jgi:hypothetical protein
MSFTTPTKRITVKHLIDAPKRKYLKKYKPIQEEISDSSKYSSDDDNTKYSSSDEYTKNAKKFSKLSLNDQAKIAQYVSPSSQGSIDYSESKSPHQ